MTRVATPKNEDALPNAALHGTASHVEKQVQRYRRLKRSEALDQRWRNAHGQTRPAVPPAPPAGSRRRLTGDDASRRPAFVHATRRRRHPAGSATAFPRDRRDALAGEPWGFFRPEAVIFQMSGFRRERSFPKCAAEVLLQGWHRSLPPTMRDDARCANHQFRAEI